MRVHAMSATVQSCLLSPAGHHLTSWFNRTNIILYMIIEYVNRDLYFIFPLTILELYSQPRCLASKSRMLKSYLIFPTSFPSSDLSPFSWAANRKKSSNAVWKKCNQLENIPCVTIESLSQFVTGNERQTPQLLKKLII